MTTNKSSLLRRFVLSVAVSIAALTSSARVGDGGIVITDPTHPPDEYYFDQPNVTGYRIYVGSSKRKLECHLRYDLPNTSGTVTNVKLIREGGVLVAVQYVFGQGFIKQVPVSSFKKVDPGGNPCADDYNPAAKAWAVKKKKKPTPQPVEFAVSNDADAFDTTCDGRYAVAVGANSPTPVSLVDLKTGTEVSTFAFAGLANNVATCDDDESVLVTLVDGSNAGSIRRLRIVAGALVDTGESFVPTGSYAIRKVLAVPGSKTGLALVNVFGSPNVSRLVSFSIPGLAAIDSATFAGDAHSAALSAAGDRAYAGGNAFGSLGDTVKGFTYDPVTGALGDAAILSIGGLSSAYPRIYENVLAVSPDGTRLVVSEPADFPTADVPSPQVTYFDTTTGARVDKFASFANEDFLRVRTLSTARRCGPAPVACADLAACLEALRIALPDRAAAPSRAARSVATKLAKSLGTAKKKAELAAAASGTKAAKLYLQSEKALAGLANGAHAAFRKGTLSVSLVPIDDAVVQFYDHLP